MEATSRGGQAVESVYYAFVLSIPLETFVFVKSDEGVPGGVSISRILGMVLLGLALVHRRRCFRRIPAAFWMIAWYLAVYALSQLWVPVELDDRFHQQQLTLFQMVALFLLSYNLFADDDFRPRLLRVFGWGIGLAAAAMVLGLVGAPFGHETRNAMLYGNPNSTGALFAFGAICLAGDPWVIGPRKRAAAVLLSLAALPVLVVGILRTGSRSGLLAFGAGIIGLAICGSRTNRGARLAISAVTVLLLAGLVGREFQNSTGMAARLERSWTRGDTAGRTGIYEAAWSMFLERPLLGYGGANNRFVLGTGLNNSGRRGREADRDTHNVFLAVLTEVGLIGGLPFIAALFLVLWTGWRAGRMTGDGLPFALMCALMITNSAGTGFRHKQFWIVLAAAAAVGCRKDRLDPRRPAASYGGL